jgi:hypothetical protein
MFTRNYFIDVATLIADCFAPLDDSLCSYNDATSFMLCVIASGVPPEAISTLEDPIHSSR